MHTCTAASQASISSIRAAGDHEFLLTDLLAGPDASAVARSHFCTWCHGSWRFEGWHDGCRFSAALNGKAAPAVVLTNGAWMVNTMLLKHGSNEVLSYSL